MWCVLRAKEWGPLPIFPPVLRDTLCNWLVHDCLSRFGSSDPFLTMISRCCCAFIFVSVFLTPLPSVPVSVDYTNPLCWLLDPALVPTWTLENNSVLLLSAWIHLPHLGQMDTLGNECSHPGPAQALHLPCALGNPFPGPFIHQHLPKSLQQTSWNQRQRWFTLLQTSKVWNRDDLVLYMKRWVRASMEGKVVLVMSITPTAEGKKQAFSGSFKFWIQT